MVDLASHLNGGLNKKSDPSMLVSMVVEYLEELEKYLRILDVANGGLNQVEECNK